MKRHSLTLLAAALITMPGCEAQPTEADAEAKRGEEPASASDKIRPEPAAAEPEGEVLASGLAVGERFRAFQIVNCESGDEYCQVCKFGPSPKILAAGTFGDEAFKKDLKDIDAILAQYGDDKVKAFAVMGELDGGKLATPTKKRAELEAKAKALKEELGLSYPIVIPASKDGARNEIWEDHYQISRSRTLMLADGRNTVKYSQIAPANLGGLDAAVREVVEG
jgi:hypothetical protein